MIAYFALAMATLFSAQFSMCECQSTLIWTQRILLQLIFLLFFPLASLYAARIPAHNDSAFFFFFALSITTCFYSSTTPRHTTRSEEFFLYKNARALHTRLWIRYVYIRLFTWTYKTKLKEFAIGKHSLAIACTHRMYTYAHSMLYRVECVKERDDIAKERKRKKNERGTYIVCINVS